MCSLSQAVSHQGRDSTQLLSKHLKEFVGRGTPCCQWRDSTQLLSKHLSLYSTPLRQPRNQRHLAVGEEKEEVIQPRQAQEHSIPPALSPSFQRRPPPHQPPPTSTRHLPTPPSHPPALLHKRYEIGNRSQSRAHAPVQLLSSLPRRHPRTRLLVSPLTTQHTYLPTTAPLHTLPLVTVQFPTRPTRPLNGRSGARLLKSSMGEEQIGIGQGLPLGEECPTRPTRPLNASMG
jgi:hypothetical protein